MHCCWYQLIFKYMSAFVKNNRKDRNKKYTKYYLESCHLIFRGGGGPKKCQYIYVSRVQHSKPNLTNQI